MTNELIDLFQSHLENHLYELKILLTSKLQNLGIGTTVEQTDIPEELREVQKQLLIMIRSFYQDTQKNIMNTVVTPLEMQTTENTSPQTLDFIERIEAFHQELNEFTANNNVKQFLGYSIGILSLGNAFLFKPYNDFFFPKEQQVIDEILEVISLKSPDSWARKTSDTIEYSKKISNDIKNNHAIQADKYSEVFHILIDANQYTSTTHNDLIQFGKKLGYSLNDKGICRGYTMRWIEATLLKQQPRFLNRTYKIKALNRLLNEGKTLEELKKQTEWLDIWWDIKAFYESLYLFQEANELMSIFAKKLKQQDITEISELASSDELLMLGGIKHSPILRYDEFSKDGLLTTLGKLEEKIIASQYQEPVCFILSCSKKGGSHAINATYYPSDGTWQWMDVNLPIQRPNRLHHLKYDFSHELFWDNLFYFECFDIFSISAVLPKANTLSLENALLSIKKFECTNIKSNQLILFNALLKGDLETTLAILAQEGIDLNQTNIHGETPLIIAAECGRQDILTALLNHKEINPNQVANDGISALLIAILKGHQEVVKALLAREDLDPNQDDFYGTTPLFFATLNNKIEVVKHLLKHKKIDITKPLKKTPKELETFVRNARSLSDAIIKRIDEHISQYQLKYPDATIIEITPEEIAMIMGHLDILKILTQFSQLHQSTDETPTNRPFGP